MTERPKFLNSSKKFGALAECPALLQAFTDLLRPCRFNQALLRFGAALHAALKRHQSAVGVN